MKRQFITYFLLGVLALQLLPVKEMGQLLYNNQLTEEICDGLDSAKEHSEHQTAKKITEDEFLSKVNTEQRTQFDNAVSYLQQEVSILSRVFDDTITPPPLA